MKKVCRDCTKVSSGRRGRCQFCNSSNLGEYFSPQERRGATQIGSDWRGHLYVSGSEYKAQKSNAAQPYTPKNSSTGNAYQSVSKRRVQRMRTLQSAEGKNSLVASLQSSTLSWLVIVVFPMVVGAFLFFPGSSFEAAIDRQLRGALGIASDSEFTSRDGRATAEQSLQVRKQALGHLWNSRREANLNGYVETVEYEAQTGITLAHPAETEVFASLSGERLSWGSTSTNYTLQRLAEAMTDANLTFSKAGERISFSNSFSECQGWIEVSNGLIAQYATDCFPLGSGYSTSLRYGLSEDELGILDEAKRLRDES